MNMKSNLSALLQRLNRVKQASDGLNTSMPDDPSGDGLMEPHTGQQYEQYAEDMENSETTSNADTIESEDVDEDLEQDNTLGTYTLSTAGSEEQSAEGEYEDRSEDPGTTMPAASGQEKFSSAQNCTLEQNIEIFQKCAQSLWQTRQQYNAILSEQVKQAAAYVQQIDSCPNGMFLKRAEELGASPEEAQEIAAIEAIAEQEPELLEALSEASPEELTQLADVAQAIEGEDTVADTEQKLASYQFTKRAIDEGASDDEINEVAAIEALVQEEPELVEALSEASPEELAQIATVAEEIDAGQVGDALSPEEAAELEKQCFFAEGTANRRVLSSMTNRQLEKAAENIDEAIAKAENGTLSEEEVAEILDEPSASEDEYEPTPECDEADGEDKESACCRKKKASSLSADELYRYSDSNDLYSLALQKRAEEEEAMYDSLSPEEQALLDSASDEELQQAIDQGQSAQEDPAVLEDMLATQPAPEEEPTEEEALNELASAMEEEGITPEALEEASKEAYYRGRPGAAEDCNTARKVADFIRSGRHVPGPAQTEKAARVRHFSHNYLKEVMPLR